MNTLVICTTQPKLWKSYHVSTGVKKEAWKKICDMHYCCCLSTTLTKLSTLLLSQAAAGPSRNVASAGIKDLWTLGRKVIMEGWLPRTQRSQELLNWVLPSIESTIPNFCYTENSEWTGFHLLPYRRTAFTSRAQEISAVTTNPSIMRGECQCTRHPEVKLTPKNEENNNLA